MNTLKEQLKIKRPSLSENSLTTYASILKNVYKNVLIAMILILINSMKQKKY